MSPCLPAANGLAADLSSRHRVPLFCRMSESACEAIGKASKHHQIVCWGCIVLAQDNADAECICYCHGILRESCRLEIDGDAFRQKVPRSPPRNPDHNPSIGLVSHCSKTGNDRQKLVFEIPAGIARSNHEPLMWPIPNQLKPARPDNPLR